MRIACISDVHIKRRDDEASRLFLAFLDQVQNFDHLILLGDIFDLLVGGQKEWIRHYPEIFQRLGEISKSTQIHYIEGNHDFHLKNLFNNPTCSKINHYDTEFKLQDKQMKLLFAHGDDIEIDNEKYQHYKKIIKSPFVKLLANKIVPVKFIAAIGNRASRASAKRSRRYELDPDNQIQIKEKFRKSAEIHHATKGPFDILVCGHSHIRDLWQSKQGFTYVNNGYFQAEKCYTIIEDGVARLEKLV